MNRTPRRLIYACGVYPPFGAGGAETTISLHARILARQGWRITVVTPNFGDAPASDGDDALRVVRFPTSPVDAIGKPVHAAIFEDPAFQRNLAGGIVAAADGDSVLCVHAQGHHVFVGADRAARRLGVPLVVHVRDTSSVCLLGAVCTMERGRDHPPPACGRLRHARCYLNRTLPIYWPAAPMAARASSVISLWARQPNLMLRQRIMAGAGRVAFASDGLRRLYGHLRVLDGGDRQRVVYAPVVADEPAIVAAARESLPAPVRALNDAGRPMILFVGKVSKGKGFDVLAAAHRTLLASRPDAHLVVAGNAQGGDWNLDPDRVVRLGFVDGAAVAALFIACDVVVVPSTWPEPLGWATLNAGKYGKPLVATRVGGIPEAVIDGETGILVDKRDATAMAAAMDRLLADPSGARAMGTRARAFVFEKFGEAAVLRQLEALYDGLEAESSRAS